MAYQSTDLVDVSALKTLAAKVQSDYPTKKAVTSEISAAVAGAAHMKRVVVASIESINITAADADQYIYMVPKGTAGTADKYNEYLVVDGALEKVGDWGVDLSGYQQKEAGKGLSTNDYTTTEKSKLAGIDPGANKYTLPTASASTLGGVKTGSNITNSDGTISVTKKNVTDALGYTPPSTNTTYAVMTGATASAAGSSGLVPAPAAGKQAQYLRGDGTWQTPPNTTYGNATSSAAGLMSAADKAKLDGMAIATTAEVDEMIKEVFG